MKIQIFKHKYLVIAFKMYATIIIIIETFKVGIYIKKNACTFF